MGATASCNAHKVCADDNDAADWVMYVTDEGHQAYQCISDPDKRTYDYTPYHWQVMPDEQWYHWPTNTMCPQYWPAMPTQPDALPTATQVPEAHMHNYPALPPIAEAVALHAE